MFIFFLDCPNWVAISFKFLFAFAFDFYQDTDLKDFSGISKTHTFQKYLTMCLLNKVGQNYANSQPDQSPLIFRVLGI